MNTNQDKLRRVLRVIGWVQLGVVTVGGLLTLLRSRFAIRLPQFLQKLFAIPLVVFVVICHLFTLVFLPSNDVPDAFAPNSVWVCEQTGVQLIVDENGYAAMQEYYEGELCTMYIDLSRDTEYCSIVLVAPEDEPTLYQEVFSGLFWLNETEFCVEAAYDLLYDGRYEELHFYRTDTD